MQRQKQLSEWLKSQFPGSVFDLAPASADASFRRYFRATFPDSGCDTLLAKPADYRSDHPAAPDGTTSHSSRPPQNGVQVAGYPASDGSTAPCLGVTLIVMDAPPQHENCRPFLHIAKLFEDAGVHVPHVYAQDLEQGFLLLSDLGSTRPRLLEEFRAERVVEKNDCKGKNSVRIAFSARHNSIAMFAYAFAQ